MKQSLKAYLPKLNRLTLFDKFVEMPVTGEKFIAHCMDGERKDLIGIKQAGNQFTLLIGPEGDFSEPEIELAISKGFLPVSFGASRLRTETAGVVACQIIADLKALQ